MLAANKKLDVCNGGEHVLRVMLHGEVAAATQAAGGVW